MDDSQKLDEIKKMLENYVEFSTEQFSDIREKIESLDIKLNQTKLDLLNKLASKEKVDNHELRIQDLESQTTKA